MRVEIEMLFKVLNATENIEGGGLLLLPEFLIRLFHRLFLSTSVPLVAIYLPIRPMNPLYSREKIIGSNELYYTTMVWINR